MQVVYCVTLDQIIKIVGDHIADKFQILSNHEVTESSARPVYDSEKLLRIEYSCEVK